HEPRRVRTVAVSQLPGYGMQRDLKEIFVVLLIIGGTTLFDVPLSSFIQLQVGSMLQLGPQPRHCTPDWPEGALPLCLHFYLNGQGSVFDTALLEVSVQHPVG